MTTEPADFNIDPEDQQWLQQEIAKLTFADILRSHRHCEGWSQMETAKRLGISKQMLSTYETGRNIPSLKKAYEIGQKLGIVPESAVLAVVNDQLRQENLPIQMQLSG